jgi:hypothetical protein
MAVGIRKGAPNIKVMAVWALAKPHIHEKQKANKGNTHKHTQLINKRTRNLKETRASGPVDFSRAHRVVMCVDKQRDGSLGCQLGFVRLLLWALSRKHPTPPRPLSPNSIVVAYKATSGEGLAETWLLMSRCSQIIQ